MLNSAIAVGKTKLRPGVRIVYLDDLDIAPVHVHPDGTVISFPLKPDIHVGKKGSFDIVFVENDLVVSPKIIGTKTNLFIYLLGKRYTIKLIYSGNGGDQIISIRDSRENRLEVEVK